ncbi:MAG: hypothetical protein HC866_20460 [Leptolyngbyaceae cyanobacterium RU_5_1]|nr:hypothetical protein [Leptolyngbyaceae cyanobacterium RU_5_1]
MHDTVTQLSYRSLPSLEEAKQVAQVSLSHIRELGDVICKHGLYETFGVCLLHRHFNVDNFERLVHQHEQHLNQVFVTPSRTSSNSTAGCIWGITPETTDQAWIDLEYFDVDQFPSVFATASDLLREQDEFLSEISSVLRGSGLDWYFGLGIFHRDVVQLSEGSVLAEFSDDEARTLTVRAATPAEIDPLHNTTTMWRFQPGADPLVASLCCHQHGPTCSGDKH